MSQTKLLTADLVEQIQLAHLKGRDVTEIIAGLTGATLGGLAPRGKRTTTKF